MNINPNQLLIIYDKSYGIYASTLYIMLESLEYKNLAILSGGLGSILKIDPNQKLYNEYTIKLTRIARIISKENNTTLIKGYESKVVDLNNKLKILKPYLLSSTNKIKDSKKDIFNVNNEYFLNKMDLENTVIKMQKNNETNMTIIDICPMVDIIGNQKGSYLSKVTAISWKELIDKKKYSLKSQEELDIIFQGYKLNKDNNNYIYCMSGSPKAFYLMTVMRYMGYKKVKAFTGDWNVWIGDIDE